MVDDHGESASRTNLSRDQAAALDREAKRRGQTRSHLIREAIDQTYLMDPARDELTDALDAAFGAWKDRAETGEQHVERARSGDRFAEMCGDDWSDEADAE